MEKPNKSATHQALAEYAINELRVPSYQAMAMTKEDLYDLIPADEETAEPARIDPQDIGPGHGSLWDETWGSAKPAASPAETSEKPVTKRGRNRG